MKHAIRFFMTSLLLISILTPVMAKTADSKIVRFEYYQLSVNDESEGFQKLLLIGTSYPDQNSFAINYYQIEYGEEIDTQMIFIADLPTFSFPKSLVSKFTIDLCATGEEFGYWYNNVDETSGDIGPLETEHCFSVFFDFKETTRSSYMTHNDDTELGKYFGHYKSTSYSYIVEGTFDDVGISDAEASITHATSFYGYPQAVFDGALSKVSTAGNDMNPIEQNRSYSLTAFNDYVDPAVNPYRYISIYDNNTRDGMLNIDMERYLFDGSGEIIGTTQFSAEIPDTALTRSKSNLVATVDTHAYGISCDFLYGEGKADNPDDPPEIIPYEDNYVVQLTWNLSYLYGERFISRSELDGFKFISMNNSKVYAGMVAGTIDDIEFESPQGSQIINFDHHRVLIFE